MNVASVSLNVPVMKANPVKRKAEPCNDGIPTYSPAVVGVVNGLCWGTVGYAFDKVCSKLLGYKSSNKVSLPVNGIIGAGMGIYSYVQAKKYGNKA